MSDELTREERDKIRRHWRGGGAADYAIGSLLDALDAKDARIAEIDCQLEELHEASPFIDGVDVMRDRAKRAERQRDEALAGQTAMRPGLEDLLRKLPPSMKDMKADALWRCLEATAYIARRALADVPARAKKMLAVVEAAREACRTQDTDDFMRLVLALRELDGVDPRTGESLP